MLSSSTTSSTAFNGNGSVPAGFGAAPASIQVQQPNFYSASAVPAGKPSSSLSYPHPSLPQVPVLRINDVAMQFGRQYYTMLSRETDKVHFFYNKQSYSQHGTEGDQEAPLCFGLEEIHQRINALGYSGCRVFISNIDCQPSVNGGIMIMTVGRIQLKSGSVKRFVQTVFLAEQPSGYYVLNDMFRFINAESDDPVPVVERSSLASSLSPSLSSLSSAQVEQTLLKTTASPSVVLDKKQEAEVVPAKAEEPEKKETKEVKEAKEVKEEVIKTPQNKPGPIAPPSAARSKEPSSPTLSSPSSTNSSSWASLAAIQDAAQWKSTGIIAAAESVKVVITETPVIAEPAAPQKKTFTPRAQQSQQQQQPKGEWKPHFNPAASIYVGGLRSEPKPTEQVIRQVFSVFGEIKTVDWGKDCAYVEFESAEAAQKIHNQVVNVVGTDVKILPRRVIHPGYRFHNNNTNNQIQNSSNQNNNYSNNRSPRVFTKKTSEQQPQH